MFFSSGSSFYKLAQEGLKTDNLFKKQYNRLTSIANISQCCGRHGRVAPDIHSIHLLGGLPIWEAENLETTFTGLP
jgi:hypothetical protein